MNEQSLKKAVSLNNQIKNLEDAIGRIKSGKEHGSCIVIDLVVGHGKMNIDTSNGLLEDIQQLLNNKLEQYEKEFEEI